MGFYGNYLKINAGEGLIVEEKGQEIDINLAPQLLNFLNSKEPVIKGTIQTEADFDRLVQGIIPNANNKVLEIGDCFRVIKKIEIAKENSSKYNYDDYGNMNSEGNTIIEENTILMCVKYQEQGNQMPENKWYFQNYTDLLNKVKIHPVWNGDNNKVLKFYNEEVESDSVEDNSIIVDRENQTISVKKDGEKIIVGNVNDIGLEKGGNGNGLQSVNAENQIQAENSFGFGKGLKNTESNVNQFIRGQYNEIDEKNKYIDIVGNGSSDEQRSNAYALDKDGNAYFSGDVYVQSKNGKEPNKLLSELAAVQEKAIVQSNNAEIINVSQIQNDESLIGVKVTNWGNYSINVFTEYGDYIFSNDGNSSNQIKWPYSGEQNVNVEGLNFSWNSFGEIIINGVTQCNATYYFSQTNVQTTTTEYLIAKIISGAPKETDKYNITLVKADNNLGIFVDIKSPTAIEFKNCVIQPYYSSKINWENDELWKPPHGSFYSVLGNGTLILDPLQINEQVTDLELYSYNKNKNLQVNYTSNINKLLNFEPELYLSNEQIALKKDTLYVNARVGQDIIKVRPVLSLNTSALNTIGNAPNVEYNAQEEDNRDLYLRLYQENVFQNNTTNFTYYDDSNNYSMEHCLHDITKVYKVNHTKHLAEQIIDLQNILTNLNGKVTKWPEAYKTWDEKIDKVLLIDKEWIYFLKYTNVYTVRLYDQDENREYHTFYNGVFCKYNFKNKDFIYKVYETEVGSGSTVPETTPSWRLYSESSLGVARSDINYSGEYYQCTYIGSSSSDPDIKLKALTETVSEILHTKNFIVLCHSTGTSRYKNYENYDYGYLNPQISWINKETMELVKMYYTLDAGMSRNYTRNNGYLPLYHSDQVFMNYSNQEQEIVQLTAEKESKIQSLKTSRYYEYGYSIYNTRIFWNEEKYIMVIHFRTDQNANHCTIVKINSKEDEKNKIVNVSDSDWGGNISNIDEEKYLKLFPALNWWVSKNSALNLYNLSNKNYNIQTNNIYYNYKLVDVNDSKNILTNLINASEVIPENSLEIPYAYNIFYDNVNQTDILYKDFYYSLTNVVKRVKDGATAQRYNLEYYELVSEN